MEKIESKLRREKKLLNVDGTENLNGTGGVKHG